MCMYMYILSAESKRQICFKNKFILSLLMWWKYCSLNKIKILILIKCIEKYLQSFWFLFTVWLCATDA